MRKAAMYYNSTVNIKLVAKFGRVRNILAGPGMIVIDHKALEAAGRL